MLVSKTIQYKSYSTVDTRRGQNKARCRDPESVTGQGPGLRSEGGDRCWPGAAKEGQELTRTRGAGGEHLGICTWLARRREQRRSYCASGGILRRQEKAAAPVRRVGTWADLGGGIFGSVRSSRSHNVCSVVRPSGSSLLKISIFRSLLGLSQNLL